MTRALTLALCTALLGCNQAASGADSGPSTGDAGTGTVDSGPSAPDAAAAGDSGPPVLPPIGTRIPEAEASTARSGCQFGAGAMPWETIGSEFPIGDQLPFDHIVVVMMENRSFDHYFGKMPGVDGIPGGATNPDAQGTPVAVHHATEYCIRDVNHGWNGSHRQFNGGANDGFVTTNDPDGARALGVLERTDIPFYYDLYETFAMSDHHHCSVLGPTWVNRFYMTSGTSFGNISNMSVEPDRVPTTDHILFQQLNRRNVDWRIYYANAPVAYGLYPHWALDRAQRPNIVPNTNNRFQTDLQNGTLPRVVFLDPAFGDTGASIADATDEHPPSNPQQGQRWVSEQVRALMNSPYWSRTVLILTYDEHGGFYDHVPPPAACPPGDFPPNLGASDVQAGFDRLGFRVPLVVVSPWSKAHYVSNRVTDHASILRLIQARYLLPAMTGRDANAWPLLDMFDFQNPPHMTPPELEAAVVSPAGDAQCRAFQE